MLFTQPTKVVRILCLSLQKQAQPHRLQNILSQAV